MIKGEFAASVMDKSIIETAQITQDEGEWVDAYIESKPEEPKDYSVEITEIGCYVAALIFSCMAGNAAGAATSVYGLISIIAPAFKPSEPGIQDVLNRLDEIDEKLDEINNLIKKNQSELINEQIYTEAMIDKLTADQYQRDITAYVTNYINPIESIERKYSQYIEASYKALVKSNPGYINLHFKRNDKNELILLSQSETAYDNADLVIRVPMDSYANSKKFLLDHNDVVTEGFTEELDKDIDATIENHIGKELPNNEISKENYRFYINSAILDEFEKHRHNGEYGSEAYKDASDMLDKAIELMKMISGTATGQSILESFIGRLKYIYNFAAEAKEKVRSIIANIKFQMERYASMVETACRYAKINAKELIDEYMKAVDTIQSYHKVFQEMPETYSFITNTVIHSQFMYAKYETQFRHEGENPQFNKEFVTEQIDQFNMNDCHIIKSKVDITKVNLVNKIDAARINKRYQIMLNSGFTTKTDYLNYLVESKGIHQNNYNLQQAMIDAKYIKSDSYRILTDYEGISDVSKKDNITFTCTARGNNEGGDYFQVGKKYTYQCKEGDEYWRGEKASGRFISAHNGTEQSNHLISAYARYSESHWYWTNNEHWAFSSNPDGEYFYMMYIPK